MRATITAVLGPVLLLAGPLAAADLYLQSRDVTKSEFYNGQPGKARIEPLSTQAWLQLHSGSTESLGIRDYGFVIENPQLRDLTYGIANRLLEHWPGTVPQLAIFVQGDGSPLLYGASTTHAREIFIRYGVFVHAESEDEIAAVIAHELAHVLLEHTRTLDYKKTMATSLETLQSVSDIYATADALRMDREAKKITLDPGIESDLLRSAEQRMLADRVYGSVHASLFSRRNEQDADSLALDLLVAAGYSPQGLKSSLERMAHSHDLSTEVSSFFEASSKELLESTLTAVQQYTDENGIQSDQLKSYMENSQDQLKRSALEFGKNALVKFSARSHPVPAKRVEKFTDYLYDSYPRSVRRRGIDRDSAAGFRSGPVAEVIGQYTVANQALIAAAAGEVEAASKLADDAVKVPTSRDPYTRYAAFNVQRQFGARDAALGNLKAMDTSAFVPLHAATEMAEFLAHTQALDELQSLVERNESVFGPVSDFYPAKISLALAAGDQGRVEQLAMECYGATDAGSSLATGCQQASGVAPPDSAVAAAPAKALGDIKKLFGPK